MEDSLSGRDPVVAMRRPFYKPYADYDFRPAQDVFGEPGGELLAWWAQALAERALIHPDHYRDAAENVLVEFATNPGSVMHYAFYGSEIWVEDWGDSLEDARAKLAESTRDFAEVVNADRNGVMEGHHPWDDPARP
jgi:hypothetical protein